MIDNESSDLARGYASERERALEVTNINKLTISTQN